MKDEPVVIDFNQKLMEQQRKKEVGDVETYDELLERSIDNGLEVFSRLAENMQGFSAVVLDSEGSSSILYAGNISSPEALGALKILETKLTQKFFGGLRTQALEDFLGDSDDEA